MSISVYFDPLDTACKNITGVIKEGDLLQLNIFLLKAPRKLEPWNTNKTEFHTKTPSLEECMAPSQNAFLRFNRDGEVCDFYPMTKTDFGWSISLKVHEIGLYFYSFFIEKEGKIVFFQRKRENLSRTVDGILKI